MTDLIGHGGCVIGMVSVHLLEITTETPPPIIDLFWCKRNILGEMKKSFKGYNFSNLQSS